MIPAPKSYDIGLVSPPYKRKLSTNIIIMAIKRSFFSDFLSHL